MFEDVLDDQRALLMLFCAVDISDQSGNPQLKPHQGPERHPSRGYSLPTAKQCQCTRAAASNQHFIISHPYSQIFLPQYNTYNNFTETRNSSL